MSVFPISLYCYNLAGRQWPAIVSLIQLNKTNSLQWLDVRNFRLALKHYNSAHYSDRGMGELPIFRCQCHVFRVGRSLELEKDQGYLEQTTPEITFLLYFFLYDLI